MWASRNRQRDRLSPSARERIDALEAELDDRIEDIHRLEARLADLELRTDFAERLLAERSDAAALTPPN